MGLIEQQTALQLALYQQLLDAGGMLTTTTRLNAAQTRNGRLHIHALGINPNVDIMAQIIQYKHLVETKSLCLHHR